MGDRMTLTALIKRQESLATEASLAGKAKKCRAHKLRAEQLRKVKAIKKELRR